MAPDGWQKAQYAVRIFMFSSQIKLTAMEEKALQHIYIYIFVVTVYVRCHGIRSLSRYTFVVTVYFRCLGIHSLSRYTFVVTVYVRCHGIRSLSRYTATPGSTPRFALKQQEMTWLSSRNSPLVSNKEVLIIPVTFDSYVWYHRNVYIILRAYGHDLQPLVATPKHRSIPITFGQVSFFIESKIILGYP